MNTLLAMVVTVASVFYFIMLAIAVTTNQLHLGMFVLASAGMTGACYLFVLELFKKYNV